MTAVKMSRLKEKKPLSKSSKQSSLNVNDQFVDASRMKPYVLQTIDKLASATVNHNEWSRVGANESGHE